MKYIALICARGGSKGLPGKNIKPLNGTPLIGWSIKIAKKVERISRVIVSTD
jgi:CMP-N-acetylneuraminic acid synthetase